MPEPTPRSGSIAYRYDCPVCGTYRISDLLIDWLGHSQLTSADRLHLSTAACWHATKGTPLFLREPEDMNIFVQTYEAKAVAALISAGEVQDPWRLPIHAVDRATELKTAEAKILAHALLERRVVHIRTRVRDMVNPDERAPLSWWERGE
jgi:hypothetical protein